MTDTESNSSSSPRRSAGTPDTEQVTPGISIQTEVATYELARDELSAVVQKLEAGGLSLDDSLTLWERGEHLAALCNRFLDNARERVESALARAEEAT